MALKVAIVGAGPAGLKAAEELARLGADPVLYEKHDKIGSPVRCGEGLFDLHHVLKSPPPGARVAVEEVLVRLKKLHVLRVRDANVWVLDKDVWLRSIAREAESLGAEILLDTKASIAALRKEYDFVLDCSGFPSQSLREYGISYRTLALGIQYTVRADVSAFLKKLYTEYVPGEVGFRWIFAKSRREANVGVGWAHSYPHGKWKRLEEFCDKRLGEYTVTRTTSGYIPMRVQSKLLLGNVLLCGDAAGLANPYHAGGVHNALLSGALAARLVAEGKEATYEESLLSATRGELGVARFARWALETSYGYHEKVVSYLEGHFSLSQIFSEEVYRRLLPLIQMWRVRCFLLRCEPPSI